MPRIRDFRGLNPKSFDGRGNYAMGLKEQLVFPEISYDRIDKVRGLDVIVTTTAKTDEEARELLRLFGFPFPQADAEQRQRSEARRVGKEWVSTGRYRGSPGPKKKKKTKSKKYNT